MAGAQLALTLHLPVYLDSIGTIMAGAMLGPVYGMLPSFLSGIVLGMTIDIYSFYFAPAGMIVGLMSGLAWKLHLAEKGRLWLAAAVVALPGTLVSSVICAVLFGGVTSSGSMVLVQLLARTPLGMTASIFVVQIVTEYVDRLISLFLVAVLLRTLPYDLKRRWKGEVRHGDYGQYYRVRYQQYSRSISGRTSECNIQPERGNCQSDKGGEPDPLPPVGAGRITACQAAGAGGLELGRL